MCAQTVSELLVRTRAEGVSETTDDLERQSDAFENAASTAETETGVLERFQNRWQGAMSAIVAGLAIAAAGLLSRVPVIQETMGGLNAVIDAVAFRLDDQLRPAINGVNRDLFDLANAIASGEGEFDAFMQLIGRVLVLVGDQLPAAFGTPIAMIGRLAQNWREVWNRIRGVASRVTGRLDSIFGDWRMGLLFGMQLLTDIMTLRWGRALQRLLDLASAFLPNVDQLFADLRDDIWGTFQRIISDAFRSGRSIVQSLIDGLRSKLTSLRSWVNRVAGMVRDHLPGSDARRGPLSDLSQTGPALVDTFTEGMQSRTGQLSAASGRVATAADPRGQGTGTGASGGGDTAVISQLESLARAMTNNTVEVPVNLDSREVARGVAPLIGQGAVNIGATGVRR